MFADVAGGNTMCVPEGLAHDLGAARDVNFVGAPTRDAPTRTPPQY